MITEQALQEAIAECQGQTNPNRDTCMMLAAFYTIQDRLYPVGDRQTPQTPMTAQSYSYADPPEQADQVRYDSGTAFSEAIKGMKVNDVLATMDEAMTTLNAVMPRLYNGIMRQLKE